VLVAALAGLVLAVLTVRLASGAPARRPTLTLLRRVPARALRSAGLAEGIAVAGAAASLVAAAADPAGRLALLAPALLALVAGIVTARLLQLWSRIRVVRHANRGAITGMLAHAQLSRRPAARRAMLVVTVAVALVSFAGAAWDVAAQARTDAAIDTVGAPRVLRVAAADPAALASAVRVAAGDQAMPVVRVTERYDAGTVEVLAVDAERLASVARWRDHSSSEVDGLATSLRASGEVPVIVAGRTPADDEAATAFSFPGLGEGSQRYRVVGHVAALPRALGRALLVDLGTAVAAAQRASGLSDNSRLRYEVWAGDGAPADLGARLANAGVAVIDEDSVAAEEAHLAAGAPALGLRLALLAGAVAVALAVGAVLLTAYLGARIRRYEFAALRATGVRARTLRRAVAREYVHLLVVPGLAGLAVGLAGAVLLLPGIPLVTAGVTGAVVMPGRPLALAGAVGLTVLGLGLAVVAVLRLVGGATPERLREGSA
jgi:hypothetical protein